MKVPRRGRTGFDMVDECYGGTQRLVEWPLKKSTKTPNGDNIVRFPSAAPVALAA